MRPRCSRRVCAGVSLGERRAAPPNTNCAAAKGRPARWEPVGGATTGRHPPRGKAHPRCRRQGSGPCCPSSYVPAATGLRGDFLSSCRSAPPWSAHGMRAVGARLQTNRRDPAPYDPGILPGRKVRAAMDPARPKEFGADHLGAPDPVLEGQPGRLGDLEPDRLARFALDHRRAFLHTPGGEDIADAETYKVATA